MDTKRLIKFLVAFVPLLLLLMDVPEGMDPKAWRLFKLGRDYNRGSKEGSIVDC